MAEKGLHQQNESLSASQDDLQVEQRYYHELFECAPTPYIVTDTDGIIRRSNRAACQLLQSNSDALCGTQLEDFIDASMLGTWRQQWQSLQHSSKTQHWDIILSSTTGQTVAARCDVTLSPQAVREVYCQLHVTHEQSTKSKQQKNEEQFRLITDNLPVLIAYIDAQQRYGFANPAYQKWFSHPHGETVGKQVSEILGDSAYETIKPDLEQALSGQASHFQGDLPYRDGGTRYIDAAYLPHRGEDGDINGAYILICDINEHKQAQAALHAERSFTSAILDTVGALILVIDTLGRIVTFNRCCEETTGYGFDEVNNRVFWEFLLLPEEIEGVTTVFNDLRAGLFPNKYENYWRTKDGGKRLIHWSNTAMLNEQGEVTYIIATGIDITEQRMAEDYARQRQEELAHVARVNTIGEMASGLAHEINQPLSAIINYSQGCIRRLQDEQLDSKALLGALEQITGQSQRAAAIIQHLRNFVTKGELQRMPTNISKLVRETLVFIAAEAKKSHVTVESNLSDDLPLIHVDAIQIEQIIVNLLRDALEAMRDCDYGNHCLQIQTRLAQSGNIELAVSDTGPGLIGDDAEQIFAPFYTTKPGGMGLGLAISRTIAEAHGGQLWARPNPDRGVTFHLYLPVEIDTT